jgi:hypothetical protein
MPLSIDSYFSISFADLIGFIITIFSVVLIIRQLKEARLATQLAGFLALSDQFGDIAIAIEFVDSLCLSQKWNDLDGTEAYNYLTENDKNRGLYKQVGAFYEVLAALIRRGALDKTLAIDTFGNLAGKRFNTLQKAIIIHRELLGEKTLYDQWEWMSIEINSI